MNLEALNRKRLFNSIGVGDIQRVQDVLALGIDPNVCDQRGCPAIVRAARTRIPESGVVDALLEAGADPSRADEKGLTALDYARRRRVGEPVPGTQAPSSSFPLGERTMCGAGE